MGWFRLLLALLVFHSHFEIVGGPTISGHQAVELFFVVSGFFMSLVLREKYATAGGFYRSRFLRLFPAYWAALAASLLLLFTLDAHPLTCWKSWSSAMTESPWQGLALGLAQVFVIGQDWLFGLRFAPGGGLLPAPNLAGDVWQVMPVVPSWSLAPELCFYLLAPLLARCRSRTLAGLLLLALGLRLLAANAAATPLGRHAFPLQGWLFLAGMLSHRAYERLRPAMRRGPALWGAAGAMGLALLALGCAGLGGFESVGRFPWLVAGLCAGMPAVFELMRESRLDRALGEFTYPFYLVHYPVIALLEQQFGDTPAWTYPLWAALAALALWAMAIRPFRGPGGPVMRARRRAAAASLPAG
jgi:peptidoglycan/LPS O-acetylase OafA/YrhL